VLVALLGAGHAVLWQVAVGRLEAGFHAWAAARRAEGWQVAHAAPERGGWPFAAALTLPDLRVGGTLSGMPAGMAWRSERVRLSIAPPLPDKLRVEAQGSQRLLRGQEEWPFSAGSLVAFLPLNTPSPGHATILARQLRLGATEEATMVAEAEAELDFRANVGGNEPAATLALALRGLSLPMATPLGREVEAMMLEAALTGPLPRGAMPPAALAAAWRDAGGTLEVRALTLRWGEVAASSAATLALDETLQPTGAGTLRVAGADRVLDALAASGTLPPASAAIARTVLPLLLRPDPAGGPLRLEVPVTLENRTLSAARIPLRRLPPVDWGR